MLDILLRSQWCVNIDLILFDLLSTDLQLGAWFNINIIFPDGGHMKIKLSWPQIGFAYRNYATPQLSCEY